MTFLKLKVKKLPESRQAAQIQFLIDTGAIYTVAPAAILRKLGIKPHRHESFILADGTAVERRIGGAYFEYKGIGGVAPVIFGEASDSKLLGMTTLEAMGLMVDPLSRELKHLPAMLGLAFQAQPKLTRRG